ncbi:hypothetical protein ROU88_01755 [Macrococcus capreoli]
MNCQLYLTNDLIMNNSNLNITINQMHNSDISDLISKLENIKVNKINLELNIVITQELFNELITKLSIFAPIQTLKLDLKCYTKSKITNFVEILSNKYLISKVNVHFNALIIDLFETTTDKAALRNNLSVMRHLNIKPIDIDENDMISILSIVKSMNEEVIKLQTQIKKKDQEMERLKKKINAGVFNDQNSNYNQLMEKYKDTLKRLENLRNSRLGKLQIKYWDLKG